MVWAGITPNHPLPWGHHCLKWFHLMLGCALWSRWYGYDPLFMLMIPSVHQYIKVSWNLFSWKNSWNISFPWKIILKRGDVRESMWKMNTQNNNEILAQLCSEKHDDNINNLKANSRDSIDKRWPIIQLNHILCCCIVAGLTNKLIIITSICNHWHIAVII